MGEDGSEVLIPPPPPMSLMIEIKEAFVTLVRATPPQRIHNEIVHAKPPYRPMTNYLIAGIALFIVAMIFSTAGLFLETPIFLTIAVSIAPLIYVIWLYRQDRYESEPISLVIFTVGWGSFAAFLVILAWTFSCLT